MSMISCLVDDYSGEFVVRVPSSLPRDLAQAATQEGVSPEARPRTGLTLGFLKAWPTHHRRIWVAGSASAPR